MKRSLIVLALFPILALSALAQGSEGAAPTVRVCGIQISGTGYGDPKDFRNHVMPLRQRCGTRLALLIEVPGKDRILYFDPVASTIARFADDKGTDLGAKDAGARPNYNATQFYSFPQLSKDGRAALIDLTSPSLPGAGAGKLIAEGEALLWLGQEQKEFEQKEFALKVGSSLAAGKLNVSIAKLGKSRGGLEVTFEFEFDAGWNPVSSIALADAEGKAVQIKPWGSYRSGSTWKVTYRLNRMVEKGTLKLNVWTKFYEKKVPFKLETGFGLK